MQKNEVSLKIAFAVIVVLFLLSLRKMQDTAMLPPLSSPPVSHRVSPASVPPASPPTLQPVTPAPDGPSSKMMKPGEAENGEDKSGPEWIRPRDIGLGGIGDDRPRNIYKMPSVSSGNPFEDEMRSEAQRRRRIIAGLPDKGREPLAAPGTGRGLHGYPQE